MNREYNYNIINDVYNWMITREKDIEVRLLKEKSNMIQVGDFIRFNNQDNNKEFKSSISSVLMLFMPSSSALTDFENNSSAINDVFYYMVELPRQDGKRRYFIKSLHTKNYYKHKLIILGHYFYLMKCE